MLCVAGSIVLSGKAGARGHAPGRVCGVVSDTNGWRVGDANVKFESPGGAHAARTNADGEYEIELPPGVYRVSVTSPGYFQMRRADVLISPAESVEINLTIFLDTPERVVRDGKVVGLRLPFNNDSFDIPESRGHLQLLILYGERSKGQVDNRYKGARLANGVVVPVIVSYNHLTVRAEEALFNKKGLTLKATGNVIVEDGKRSTNCQSIELTFKSGQAVIIKITSGD
jgi:hypothetical protein